MSALVTVSWADAQIAVRRDALQDWRGAEIAALPWLMVISDTTRARRRQRLVDPKLLAELAISRASGAALPGVAAADGGGVPNAYRYRATTSVAFAVADSVLRVVWVWVREASARGVTQSAAARICAPTPTAWAIWDGRCNETTANEARWHLASWVAGMREAQS
jgi:hypothetical protein